MGVRLDSFCHIINPDVHLGTSEMLRKPDKMLNVNSMMDQHEFMGKYIVTSCLMPQKSVKRSTDERLGSETGFIPVEYFVNLT